MEDEVSTCVALLHDIVKDTGFAFEDIAADGLYSEVILILKLLTHDDGMTYMSYIKRIKGSGNAVAIAVKLADLQHNSDASRVDRIYEELLDLWRKYIRAYSRKLLIVQ